MLLEVRDELPRSDLPNSDLAKHATRDNEPCVWRKTNGGDSSLVSIFNLPEQLTVIDSVSSNSSIRPSTDDDFVSENSTDWEHASWPSGFINLCNASSDNWVIVRVPYSDCAIFASGDELIRGSWNEPAPCYWQGVVFAKKHLAEIVVFHSI